ncbi:S41 family peptidase [Pedobacter sp. AW1-32]|uniref:S41 family peptidase n=1 Tax=Pedobacter sp. AW1-32 TaxID=3383026 RepID=UPI003FEF7B0B
MRVSIITLLIVFTYISSIGQSDAKTNRKFPIKAADSIGIFYKAFFKTLKVGYLNRKKIDWKSVEADAYKSLESYDNFKASLKEITNIFDKINATHCLVYRGDDKYTSTRKKISKDLYSAEWKNKYDSKPSFEVKVLDDKIGYVMIPGMVFFDNSAENISRIAQPLYDRISAIKSSHTLAGWIIDLRLNTGGNSSPMLLALYDLLGNNEIWGELDENKKLVRKFRLINGSYIQKSHTIAAIIPSGRLLDQERVAVITGMFTGSSGEVTALAFKGRKNTIFIGGNTAGFTTGNVTWPLPFDSLIALTTGYDSDRDGNYYPYIVPDLTISKQDNFDNLMYDGNIQEAIKFIKSKNSED